MSNNFTDFDDFSIDLVHYLDHEKFFSVTNFVKKNFDNQRDESLDSVIRRIVRLDAKEVSDVHMYAALHMTFAINALLFATKDVEVLNELIEARTDNEAERYVKTLSLIGLVQEFFGMCTAAQGYTNSDFYNVVESSPSNSRLFMNIHLVHFFYHKGFKGIGLFSMYGNADLNDGEKFELTKDFAIKIDRKFDELIDSGKFDGPLVEFYNHVAEVKKLEKSDVLEFINYSVESGVQAVNPIVLRLEKIGFAEFIR